ncbi:hypothetical protein SSCI18S_01586 [Sphingobium scionense]
MFDPTCMRVHQNGATGKKGGLRSWHGTSPRCLTSKLHALVDAEGRPVSLRLTGGQVHDACEVEALIETIPKGATLLGDRGI